MTALFRLDGVSRLDPAIDDWFDAPDRETRRLARPWFQQMRDCGPDIRETMMDGHPVACIGDAAFAYVDAFTAHANVGFFEGASLEDPAGLLEGSGRRMRHVKLPWGRPVDEAALSSLIQTAAADIRARVEAERTTPG